MPRRAVDVLHGLGHLRALAEAVGKRGDRPRGDVRHQPERDGKLKDFGDCVLVAHADQVGRSHVFFRRLGVPAQSKQHVLGDREQREREPAPACPNAFELIIGVAVVAPLPVLPALFTLVALPGIAAVRRGLQGLEVGEEKTCLPRAPEPQTMPQARDGMGQDREREGHRQRAAAQPATPAR